MSQEVMPIGKSSDLISKKPPGEIECFFDFLPNELLICCLKLVDEESKTNIVCRRWNQLSPKEMRLSLIEKMILKHNYSEAPQSDEEFQRRIQEARSVGRSEPKINECVFELEDWSQRHAGHLISCTCFCSVKHTSANLGFAQREGATFFATISREKKPLQFLSPTRGIERLIATQNPHWIYILPNCCGSWLQYQDYAQICLNRFTSYWVNGKETTQYSILKFAEITDLCQGSKNTLLFSTIEEQNAKIYSFNFETGACRLLKEYPGETILLMQAVGTQVIVVGKTQISVFDRFTPEKFLFIKEGLDVKQCKFVDIGVLEIHNATASHQFDFRINE
jgi:hypothetical protein